MEIKGKNFTIGADPEVFTGNGSFVNAHGLIPGSKEEPFPVEKGAVQVDGMALEFNIDPANDFEEFSNNLDMVQAQLKQMLPEGFDFLKVASVHFDEKFLKGCPFESTILGCEPDFNAWTLQPNESPSMEAPMRTAGGHIHIGGVEGDPEDFDQILNGAKLARLMDEEVGVYSVLFDTDDQRRSMYGKAGAYRPKSYGMEYRSLSNAWLFERKLVKFVYDGTVRAINRFVDGDFDVNPLVEQIINTSDRNNEFFKNNHTAQQLMEA